MADSVDTRYHIGTWQGGRNTADPSTWGYTPLQIAQNTRALNPKLNMTDDDVQKMADRLQAEWSGPNYQAGTRVGTPVLDLGANASGEGIDDVNTWMRAQPWYQQLTQQFGKTGGFTDQEKQQLAQAAAANGVNVTNADIQFDDNGNLRNTNTGWKKAGRTAAMVAPIAAAPFTGGASLALTTALGAGSGAAQGALSGGGWKGALTGGALGAIPGVGGALSKGATGLGERALVNAGVGAAGGALQGGGVKGALTGAAGGALGSRFNTSNLSTAERTALNAGIGAGQGALRGGTTGALSGAVGGAGSTLAGQFGSPLGRSLAQTGVNIGRGAIQGGGQGAVNAGLSSAGNIYSSVMPQGGGGGMAGSGNNIYANLFNAGIGALQGAQRGGGWTGAALGAGSGFANSAFRPQPQRSPMMSFAGGGGGGYDLSGSGFADDSGGSNSYGGYDDYGNPVGSQASGNSGAWDTPGPWVDSGTSISPGPNPADPSVAAQNKWYTSPSSTPAWQGPQQPPGTPQAPPQNAGQGSWWDQWGPLAVQGGAAVGGALAARAAQKSAMQRSPEEQQALLAAQNLAGGNAARGDQVFQQGQQTLGGPTSYYQTLLNGNRAAMSQAVAPAVAQITANYRGAQRGLDQQGMRGAARDQAAGELARSRASQIAGLTTGVQPGAAQALTGIGQNLMNQAPGYYQMAAGGYGNLLAQGYQNRVNAMNAGTQAGQAMGSMIRDIGQSIPGGSRKPAPYGGAPPQSPSPSQSTMSPLPTAPYPGGSYTPPYAGGGVRQPRAGEPTGGFLGGVY